MFIISASLALVHEYVAAQTIPDSTVSTNTVITNNNQTTTTSNNNIGNTIQAPQKKIISESQIDTLLNWEPKSALEYLEHNTTLKTESSIQKTIIQKYPDWIFFVLFFLAALITLVKTQYDREFKEVFYVFKNNSITQQLYREATATGVRIPYILLNINFIVIISLWLFLVLKQSSFLESFDDLIILTSLTAIITLIVFVRNLLLNIFSWLFFSGKQIGLFNFTELQILRCTGLILYPFTLFICYTPEPLNRIIFILSIIILFSFFLFRYLRGFEISREFFIKNIFHFLIYICALEIVPLLIGIRFISNLIHQ